ncbi:MAG: threonine-phosphate decarboxylase CobD [Magnetospirillum sp.]|nr:threonine-phosphate decarboxylase CobD [Magnetospirillum sp.]
MALALPIHGGDLTAAEARWGRPAAGWLDLSTGINPWPYPLPALAPEAWTRLPGSAEDAALRRAAARRYDTPSAAHVLAAPGTSALIQALPRTRPPGPVAVVSPTYGEHARAWAAAGHDVRLAEGIEAADAPVVVVVNPNNPDGRLVAPHTLLAHAESLAAQGGLLVVDEAFGDMVPALSVAPALRPGLAVLRSFGKFYGLAGLRLGFLLAEPDLLAPVAGQLGPWPVSGPALGVGVTALADDGWAEATMARLAEAAGMLDDLLARAGLTVIGGTSLFRLAAHAQAPELYDTLGRAGILVRAFAGQPDRLRFGLPPDRRGLERLATACGLD